MRETSHLLNRVGEIDVPLRVRVRRLLEVLASL